MGWNEKGPVGPAKTIFMGSCDITARSIVIVRAGPVCNLSEEKGDERKRPAMSDQINFSVAPTVAITARSCNLK